MGTLAFKLSSPVCKRDCTGYIKSYFLISCTQGDKAVDNHQWVCYLHQRQIYVCVCVCRYLISERNLRSTKLHVLCFFVFMHTKLGSILMAQPHFIHFSVTLVSCSKSTSVVSWTLLAKLCRNFDSVRTFSVIHLST